MDEDQFRQTYHELNPQRCTFEKAINNQRCDCSEKRKFLLATRECVACEAADGPALCEEVLNNMRQSARFALKSVLVDGPLPHNKELQVQAGGLIKLHQLINATTDDSVNIHATLQQALQHYKQPDQFPYAELVQSIASYKARKRRQDKNT